MPIVEQPGRAEGIDVLTLGFLAKPLGLQDRATQGADARLLLNFTMGQLWAKPPVLGHHRAQILVGSL